MKKILFAMMMVSMMMFSACISDGPLPSDEPDATVTTPGVDGGPVVVEHVGHPVVPSVTVVLKDAGICNDAGTVGSCNTNADCNDNWAWTTDNCSGSPKQCVHTPNDCGGLQIRPATGAAVCQFWGGYGSSEPAPNLGSFAVDPSKNLWLSAPLHACSVICYTNTGAEASLDITIEWNGTSNSLQHQVITGLRKGTWDGKNLR